MALDDADGLLCVVVVFVGLGGGWVIGMDVSGKGEDESRFKRDRDSDSGGTRSDDVHTRNTHPPKIIKVVKDATTHQDDLGHAERVVAQRLVEGLFIYMMFCCFRVCVLGESVRQSHARVGHAMWR